MNFMGRRKKRRDNPLLNLFWAALFIPVAGILYLIWQEKLPWLQGEPFGDDSSNRDPGTAARRERTLVQKVQEVLPNRRAEYSPDEKRQKDAGKQEQRSKSGDRRQEDLELIEGIGPKIARILRLAGIHNFQQLADSSVDQLNEILREANTRLNPPDTWPEQARLAAQEDWDGLEQLKGQLKAGRAKKE